MLTSLEFDKRYYEEHAKGGLDYLGHGYWQQSYALMISEATLQSTYDQPFVIDAGCACGSILQGLRSTGNFARILGVDLSDYMVTIGRKHFGFSDSELVCGTVADMPVESGSVSLLHSAQVLEHIPEETIDRVLDEFVRVLRPGGRAFLCLDAIRDGETKEMYLGDPTHVNIQLVRYWTEKLQNRDLLFDIEAYNRFIRSGRGPTKGVNQNFYYAYPCWSAWVLIKP